VEDSVEVFRAPATLNSVEDCVSLLLARIEGRSDSKLNDASRHMHVLARGRHMLTYSDQLPILSRRANTTASSSTDTGQGTIRSSPINQISQILKSALFSHLLLQMYLSCPGQPNHVPLITKLRSSMILTLAKFQHCTLLSHLHSRTLFVVYSKHLPLILIRNSQAHCLQCTSFLLHHLSC